MQGTFRSLTFELTVICMNARVETILLSIEDEAL